MTGYKLKSLTDTRKRLLFKKYITLQPKMKS